MDVSIGAGLLSEAGSQVPIQIEVYDHQGQETISTVSIEAPDLFTGQLSLAFSGISPNEAFLFAGTLPNDLGAADGEYPLIVRGTDWGTDPNLGGILAWQVVRTRVGAPKGWARTWGAGLPDDARSVAIDTSGNAYVTGSFEGKVDFDPGSGVDYHKANGWSRYAFLSKFNPSGDFLWARTWGGGGGISVGIDPLGNAYVAGIFGGTVDFDPGSGVDDHTSNGGDDAFLSKLDSSGNFLGARTWGGADDDLAYSVAIDALGNAYVTGCFMETADFDPGSGADEHTSNGFSDAFLSKLDPSGDFLWARTWGSVYHERAYSVAIDALGNAYVAGEFAAAVDFDPGIGVDIHTTSGNSVDAFLSKFDSSGNFTWARTWGTAFGASVAIDPSGNACVAGCFYATADLDPGSGVDNHSSNGQSDAFLSKFDSDGHFLWVRTWGAAHFDFPESVASDAWGNAYVAGGFYDAVDFDPGIGVDDHTASGNESDAFLSKFPPDGNW